MLDDVSAGEIRKRRTFAIISHPDDGLALANEKSFLCRDLEHEISWLGANYQEMIVKVSTNKTVE